MRLDGKIWRTARTLLRSPGELSSAYFEPLQAGGRGQFAHPIRLYLTVNIFFFFLAPWINSSNISVWQVEHKPVVDMHPSLGKMLQRAIDRSGIEESLYRTIFDERMIANQGAPVFLLIPVAAVAGFAVNRRRRRFLVEHLVLATNLVSYILVSTLAVGIAGRLALAVDATSRISITAAVVVILAWMIWVPVTIYRSVRVFYEITRRRYAVAVTLWLGVAFLAGLWLYFDVLFLATLFGLHGLAMPAGA